MAYNSSIGKNWIDKFHVPQTRSFYVEIMPLIYSSCIGLGAKPASIADVGAANGSGSALVHDLMNGILGWPVQVTAFDIESSFVSYANDAFPQISYEVGDFFDSSEMFDVAIISHALEHIKDPCNMIEKMLRKAKVVVGYVPFMENDLIEGHINRFEESDITALPGFFLGRINHSIGWNKSEVAAFLCKNDQVSSATSEHISTILSSKSIVRLF